MTYRTGGLLKPKFLHVDYYNHNNEIIAPGGALSFLYKRYDNWNAWDGKTLIAPKAGIYLVSSHVRAKDGTGANLYGYSLLSGALRGDGVSVNARFSGIFYLRQYDTFEIRTLEGYDPTSTSYEPLHYITISGWEV